MREKLKVDISIEEANLILTALAGLPYAQVHELIHNLQTQIGPQLVEMERQANPAAENNKPQFAMTDTVQAFITKGTPPSEAQDYRFLREEGMRHLRSLAARTWTDHNVHDPGVTILEVLSLALTEQGFLSGLPIEDFLLTISGTEGDARDFFGKTEVLPSAPLTPMDWRRFLIDLPEVRNAWAQAVKDSIDPVVFFENNALNYTSGLIIGLNGLYDILIEWAEHPDLGELNGNLLSVPIELTLPNGLTQTYWIDLIFPFTWESEEAIDSAVPTVTYAIFRGILLLESLTLSTDNPLHPELDPAVDAEGVYFSNLQITYGGGQTVTIGIIARISSPVATPSERALLETALIARLKDIAGPVATYNRRIAKAFEQKEAIAELLAEKRNLCEDFARFRAVNIQEVGINAEIELTPGANAEETLAALFFALDTFIAPSFSFTPYAIAEQNAPVAEAIWEGPFLQNGYLDEEQLRRAPGRSIFLSDLLRLILQDENGARTDKIIAVSKLSATSFINNKVSGASAENCLRLVDDFTYRPRLSIFKSNIALRERGVERPYDFDRVFNLFQDLKTEANTAPPFVPALSFTAGETKTFPEFPEYHSIQYDFPQAYQLGVGERTPINAQLRGYLFFFEQILANHLELLRKIPSLLSVKNNQAETYSPANLRQVLPFYKEYLKPGYETALLTPNDLNSQRRSRLLDHLLARLGEDFRYYGLWNNLGGGALNQAKFDLLQALPTLAADRGHTFNYSQPSWNTGNISVTEQKLTYLLHLPDALRKTRWKDPAGSFATVTVGAPPAVMHGFRIADSVGDPLLKSPQDDFESLFDAQDAATLVIQWGRSEANYRVVEEAGSFRFWLFSPQREVIAISENTFPGTAQAWLAVESTMAYLTANWLPEEGLHLLEHILLRPQSNQDTLFAIPLDKDNNPIPLFTKDMYSMQATVVLPGAGDRFGDPGFQSVATEIIRRELPAWLHVRVFWLNIFLMHDFEQAFQNWSDPTATETQKRTFRATLIETLDRMHQWYAR